MRGRFDAPLREKKIMKIIATPEKMVVLPEELVGYQVATLQDGPSGKLYAFVEQWQAPWNGPIISGPVKTPSSFPAAAPRYSGFRWE
jgi:hypothetical protein